MNLKLKFGCDFLLNLGNITPFGYWNKKKESARREIHFYGTEPSKVLRKISAQFNFWPSNHLKFILKYFEIILFNSPFTIPLVRCFCFLIKDLYIIVIKFCLHY